MLVSELARALHQFLDCGRFRDYCPNGLQVEGRREVTRIVTGVTANRTLLEAAHAAGADCILVHHGFFWRGEDPCLTGLKGERVRYLIRHDISLLAYHLPLDAHPLVGNNARLAALCGWQADGRFGEQDLGWHGRPAAALSLAGLGQQLQTLTGRVPLVIGEAARPVRQLAWCTGAAQSFFEEAIALGVDAFVTGEISEQHVHLARESGVAFIAAGHHATERYGVQALAGWVEEQFALPHQFVDVPSPV